MTKPTANPPKYTIENIHNSNLKKFKTAQRFFSTTKQNTRSILPQRFLSLQQHNMSFNPFHNLSFHRQFCRKLSGNIGLRTVLQKTVREQVLSISIVSCLLWEYLVAATLANKLAFLACLTC